MKKRLSYARLEEGEEEPEPEDEENGENGGKKNDGEKLTVGGLFGRKKAE